MTKKEKIENFIEEYNGYLITSLVCSEDISKTILQNILRNMTWRRSQEVYI